jgi:hypothetical protein
MAYYKGVESNKKMRDGENKIFSRRNSFIMKISRKCPVLSVMFGDFSGFKHTGDKFVELFQD